MIRDMYPHLSLAAEIFLCAATVERDSVEWIEY
jgi:hypothetical protein